MTEYEMHKCITEQDSCLCTVCRTKDSICQTCELHRLSPEDRK